MNGAEDVKLQTGFFGRRFNRENYNVVTEMASLNSDSSP
jgi:hypothetical protein